MDGRYGVNDTPAANRRFKWGSWINSNFSAALAAVRVRVLPGMLIIPFAM